MTSGVKTAPSVDFNNELATVLKMSGSAGAEKWFARAAENTKVLLITMLS